MKKISLIAALAILSANAFAAESKPEFDARNCKAEYPKTALLNEEQGVVTASFLISPDGRVEDSKLEKSSGSRTLDKAAIKAISACKFKPGTKDGAPTQSWTKVDYAWSL
ncbi:MAG TPA: energy transducer TonB [Telluria sp.]|nr:energy transducer TonB [Telluria sp.]